MANQINLGRVVGKSAYEIWLDLGNEGSEEDFLNSLKGKDGETPTISTILTTEIDSIVGGQ